MASAQIPRFAVSDTPTFVFVVVCVSKHRCEHAHVRFCLGLCQQMQLGTRPVSASAVANTLDVSSCSCEHAHVRFVTRTRQHPRLRTRPRAFCHVGVSANAVPDAPTCVLGVWRGRYRARALRGAGRAGAMGATRPARDSAAHDSALGLASP